MLEPQAVLDGSICGGNFKGFPFLDTKDSNRKY